MLSSKLNILLIFHRALSFFQFLATHWRTGLQGVDASQERLWKEHLAADPATNHWIIVEENAISKIVGGCLWKWHEGNPFPDGISKPNVYWWPEGEAKEFCKTIHDAKDPMDAW